MPDELLFGANSETSDDRYGYDVAGRNKEINQLNAQLIYKYGNQVEHQVGAPPNSANSTTSIPEVTVPISPLPYTTCSTGTA